MTKDEQLAIIQATQFFNDLRAKMQAIRSAMISEAFLVQGQIRTSVDGVPVLAAFVSETDVQISVGQDDRGNALYEWRAPGGWIAPPSEA